MKKFLLTASLLCNVVLFYQLSECQKDLYDQSQRAEFYRKKLIVNFKK
ncbi:MAG TPA: hypothetical protein VK118_07085 [Tetragenococcus sp.]|nr:hypothetical protein [Tetragenococcus sp.]